MYVVVCVYVGVCFIVYGLCLIVCFIVVCGGFLFVFYCGLRFIVCVLLF